MRISVFGLGKLGSPLAAVLASRGHVVTGVDVAHVVVDCLNRGESPVYEPALGELISASGDNLNATGVGDRHDDAGSTGGEPKKWDKKGGTNDYVTGKILAQNAASLVGKVIIEYVPLS